MGRPGGVTTRVVCPRCGVANRVPPVASGTPRCGRCRAPLPWIVDADAAGFDAAVDAPVPVVVDLWAPWCGPCRLVAPALAAVAAERAGRLKVVKVDVDRAPAVADRFGVRSIPTLLLLRGGRVLDRQVGAQPQATLRAWVDRHLAPTGG